MIRKFAKIVSRVTPTFSASTGLLTKTPSKRFSTIAAAFNQNDALVENLAEQLKQEEELYNPEHSSKEYIVQKGFQVKDIASELQTVLHKKAGDIDVSIWFLPQKLKLKNTEEEKLEGFQKWFDEFFDFSIYITRPDHLTLAIDCSAVNEGYDIDYVRVVYDMETYQQRSRSSRDFFQYAPNTHSLEKELKADLMDYLETLGITKELATKLEIFAKERERRLYIQWLRRVCDFIVDKD